MRKEEVLIVVAIPVFLQHSRDFRRAERLIESFRMGDIIVVSDAPILGYLLMIGREKQVCQIAIADVRGVHGVVKESGALVLIISPPIVIIKLKPRPNAFAGVNAEVGLETILPIGLVAAAIVAQIGNGRERIGKEKPLYRHKKKAVGLSENELRAIRRAMDKDPCDARCSQIPQRIILPISPHGERCVHKQVRERVGTCCISVAKACIHRPHLHPLRNLFVGSQRVGTVFLFVRCNVSILVDPVQFVLCEDVCHRQEQCSEEYRCFFHLSYKA